MRGPLSSRMRGQAPNFFGQRVDSNRLDEMGRESGLLRALARRAVGMARQGNGRRRWRRAPPGQFANARQHHASVLVG